MRKFETLLLLSPELAADAREALLGTFTGVIERAGGRFTADHWGMRDLAYPVRKQMRGYFVRLEYVAPGDTVAELERIIRISDGAFKFLTVNMAFKKKFAPRRKFCRFCADADLPLDYKRPDILRDYITERGKIIARRITGTCAKHQRLLSTEIKRARQMALLFYTAGHSSDVKKKSNI